MSTNGPLTANDVFDKHDMRFSFVLFSLTCSHIGICIFHFIQRDFFCIDLTFLCYLINQNINTVLVKSFFRKRNTKTFMSFLDKINHGLIASLLMCSKKKLLHFCILVEIK